MKKIAQFTTIMMIALYGGSIFAASFVPGEVLVKYREGITPLRLSGGLGKIGWAKIRVENTKSMDRVLMEFRDNPDIELVTPNTYGEFLAEPNDPSFEEQWYLKNISAPEAWDMALGTGVTVAVIDSGIDLDHEDLASNILPGWDFGDNDADPQDELGHGTQVAGVLAAIQNNDRGISGIAPACRVLPVKINTGGTGFFTEGAVAVAIIYAADHGARIINLSLGWNDGEPHTVIADAIGYAAEKGVVLVAAAGNERGAVWFPARHPQVLAVASTDTADEKVYQSAYGAELELVAPGINIRTTDRGGSYTVSSGTSFAAPLVSGVAALLLSRYPGLTGEQLRAYLAMRADDLGDEGRDEEFGYGKVNALRALDPIIPFVFPPALHGSPAIPLVYLLAVFGEGTHFIPFISDVSFDSDHLVSLGPPVIALPKFLLQLAVLGRNPPEGAIPVTVATGDSKAQGYGVLSIGRLPGSSGR